MYGASAFDLAEMTPERIIMSARLFFDVSNCIRAHYMHTNKKGDSKTIANPLIFLMELDGIEPTTS